MKLILISLFATSVFLLVLSAVFLSKIMFAIASVTVIVTMVIVAVELREEHTK